MQLGSGQAYGQRPINVLDVAAVAHTPAGCQGRSLTVAEAPYGAEAPMITPTGVAFSFLLRGAHFNPSELILKQVIKSSNSCACIQFSAKHARARHASKALLQGKRLCCLKSGSLHSKITSSLEPTPTYAVERVVMQGQGVAPSQPPRPPSNAYYRYSLGHQLVPIPHAVQIHSHVTTTRCQHGRATRGAVLELVHLHQNEQKLLVSKLNALAAHCCGVDNILNVISNRTNTLGSAVAQLC
jgi:hypothetical protein